MGDLRPRRSALRVVVVLLLLLGAFFVALPWLGCMTMAQSSSLPFPTDLQVMFGPCTYQSFPSLPNYVSIPGFTSPYWGNLLLGIVYLLAAIFAAVTRRPL